MTPSRPSIILIPYHFDSRGSLMKNTCIFPGFPVDSAGRKLAQNGRLLEFDSCKKTRIKLIIITASKQMEDSTKNQ